MTAVAAAPVLAGPLVVRRPLPRAWFLAWAARAISWPLSVAAVAAGVAYRLLIVVGWLLLAPVLVGVVLGGLVLACLCLGLDTHTLGRVLLSLLALAGSLGLGWWALAGLRRIQAGEIRPLAALPGALRGLWNYLRQGLRYLAFLSDEFPRPNGTRRAAHDSFGPWHEAKRRLRRNRVAMLAWIGCALYLMVGVAAQAEWIGAEYKQAHKEAVHQAPGWFDGPWFFGTDYIGHSVGAMALRGTAVALWIGTFAAVVSCFIGGVLGALAGYFGRWVDDLIVWFYTTLESIPEILLVLAAAYVIKTNEAWRDAYNGSFMKEGLGLSLGLFTIVLVIGLTSWTGVCRQVRGEFIRQRDLDYVTAARAIGVPTGRIIFRHVFPNVMHLVLISFSLLFIGAIKYEVVLTFLGVGVEPGDSSWGRMIDQAKLELLSEPSKWWQLTAATAMLFGLVLCVNLFVDALRDALDPRLKD